MTNRGEDIRGNLKPVMKKLIRKDPLDSRFQVHRLQGNWTDHRECHIKHDWLLIWHIDKTLDRITFVRTGTHDDLFD